MSELVLGPLLRYAGTESASFWVETSTPCEVEILGHRTRTFTVEGHHYALLLVDDLEPAVGDAVRGPARRRRRVAAGRRQAAPGRPHTRPRAPGSACFRVVPARRPGAGRARRRVEGRARRAGHRRALDVLEAAAARRGRLARRAPAPRRPGLRGRGLAGDARVHPQPPRHEASLRASRSPTSRSTPASTASRGRSPTSAGCSRPCRRR